MDPWVKPHWLSLWVFLFYRHRPPHKFKRCMHNEDWPAETAQWLTRCSALAEWVLGELHSCGFHAQPCGDRLNSGKHSQRPLKRLHRFGRQHRDSVDCFTDFLRQHRSCICSKLDLEAVDRRIFSRAQDFDKTPSVPSLIALPAADRLLSPILGFASEMAVTAASLSHNERHFASQRRF